MMRAKFEEIMSQVTIETLEKLAFMFAFPGEGEEDHPRDSMVAGSVSFTGPFSGTLVMTISIEVLHELAANMLGLDDGEETTEDHRSDAFKETMNVICGNLLPPIAGDEVVFDIGVPGILSADQEMKKGAGIPDGLKPSAKVILDLDEGQCILFLFLDGEIPKDVVSQ
jgi:chemotaxis protein CheY-P-specific phosphatase CheC